MRGVSPFVRAAKWLAAIAGFAIAIGPPLACLWFGYRIERTEIDTRADLLAYEVSRLASARPDDWRADRAGIDAILAGPGDGGLADRQRLVDLAGTVLGEASGTGFSAGWSSMTGRQDVFDRGGATVGTVEIVHSLEALFRRTAWVALAALAAGFVVFLGLRFLPLRALERAWQRIAYLASHDELTRLPNRALFLDRLQTAIAAATRKRQAITVHMLDLDGFKAVNDTYGHAAGDLLLRRAAERMAGCLRQGDTLARLAGDEFAVIQDGTDRPEVATSLAKRIIAEVEKPFDLAGREALVGVSVGMAMRQADATAGADELLKHADLALYKSKASGRGCYHFYEDRMDAELQERMALEVDLRRALHDNGLRLLYEPQADLASGRVTGFEVRIAWHDPGRGNVPEAEFMRVAEGTGLVVLLNEWMLSTACAEAAGWGALRIAVNLSPGQFQSRGLVTTVRDALSRSGLQPDRLELEIVEEVLLADPERAFETLNGLKALGVRIVMDAFGIGYSSLGHLRRFPFDKIKIDRSFVSDIDRSHDARAVVRAIVGLGKALNMSVNADGVETPEQAHRLRTEGCHEIQGAVSGEAMTKAAVDARFGAGAAPEGALPAVAAFRPA